MQWYAASTLLGTEPYANHMQVPENHASQLPSQYFILTYRYMLLNTGYLQLIRVHHLYDHTARRTTAIADRRTTVLALLELVEKRHEDSCA